MPLPFIRKRRSRRPRTTKALVSICALLLSLSLACHNVLVAQSLSELEYCARYCFQSPTTIKRILDEYGNELTQPPRPDEEQDLIDEGTRYDAAIPEGLLPPVDWSRALSNNNIDIGVPVSGQDNKLLDFIRTLGKSIGQFYQLSRSNVTIRVLVTRYPHDDATTSFHERLANEGSLAPKDVVFVMTNQTDFHRAFSINMLHNATKQDERSVLAIVDVDMDVGPRFLYTSLSLVAKGCLYFPIVFSLYRPSNVVLVERFLGPQHKYSEHRGMWRVFGYGMYAISGADVATFQLDQSFQGWGGEDNDFYQRISQEPNTTSFRQREYDLVHRWHRKSCDLGSFVEPDKLRLCVKSRKAMEGSYFGQFLAQMDSSQRVVLHGILASSRLLSQLIALIIESKPYSALARSQSKRSANLEVIQSLASMFHKSGGTSHTLEDHGSSLGLQGTQETTGKILIGVTASRATIPTRVAEILQTWASDLPEDVIVRFYVGDPIDNITSYSSGSDDDIADLARQAGTSDRSMIVVMKGIQDNEYPLVYKAAAVLHHMNRSAHENDLKSRNNTVQWFFDVDDDTYVNIRGLKQFVGSLHQRHAYIGKRGMGAVKDRDMLRKGGLTHPYCMGGTGILMAKPTFQVLVDNILDCIADAQQTQDVIYDDVVFGICVQRLMGIGCWDDSSYRADAFAHNFRGSENFPRNSELWRTITVHPHKVQGLMTNTHKRFMRFSDKSTRPWGAIPFLRS